VCVSCGLPNEPTRKSSRTTGTSKNTKPVCVCVRWSVCDCASVFSWRQLCEFVWSRARVFG